jgi:hypothetical protein
MNSFSQDVITPVLGNDIQAKVIEVTKTNIAYKKWDNPNGPTLIIAKSDVLVISYADGKKEVIYLQVKETDTKEVPETKTRQPKIDTSSNVASGTITLKTGEDIQADIIEVNREVIIYKTSNGLQDFIMTIPIAEVLLISYADGTKDLIYKQYNVSNELQSNVKLKTELNSDATETAKLSKAELSMKGTRDAKINYIGRGSGAVWTAVTSVLLSPIVGLIPAAACASSRPRERNLNFDDVELKNDPNYNKAYVKQARKTKVASVLAGYIIGSAVWFVIFGVL